MNNNIIALGSKDYTMLTHKFETTGLSDIKRRSVLFAVRSHTERTGQLLESKGRKKIRCRTMQK